MRPLQLTMQAFGPYPDRQIVDFTAAIQSGLFGVYGPTGAGKSSIFSAISFALFGEPAKSEQDPASLRSDHAAANIITEVELIFEVGANRYLIRRRPDQVRPAARGGGETKEKHGAWLFDITGMALNEVTADNPGKVIAEKKVSDVAAHVERLLGYGAAQFRQIVLLPQGRFETFLTAKTDERLRILRELFDVSLYRRLAVKLKDEARTAREKIQIDLRLQGELLKREACQSLEDLDTAAAQAGSDATAHEATAKTTDTAAQEAGKALGQATQVERNFVECDAARAALTMLQTKTTDIQCSQLMLSGAQQALSLADVDAAVVVAQDRVEKAQSASVQAAGRHNDAKSAAERAVATLNIEKEQSEQTHALLDRRADLNRHRITLGEADVQRTDLAAAVQAATSARKNQVAAQANYAAFQSQRTTRVSELTLAEQKIQAHATLATEIQERQRQEGDARQYEKAAQGLTDAQTSATIAEKGAREAETAEAVALAAFEEAETKLSQAQAIHLAEKLVDGEACPVCGSSEHPSPAEGNAASAGLDAALRSTRSALDATRTKHSTAKTVLAGANATVTERKSTLDALAPPVGTAADLLAALTSLTQRRDALGALPNLDALKRVLSELDAEIEKAIQAVETTRKESDTATTNEALARQALGSALATIPVDLRSEDALSAAITTNDALIKQRQDALEAATSGERSANETLVACARDHAHAVTLHATAQADLAASVQAFTARLAEVGLGEEQYRLNKDAIGRIDELRTLIADHDRAVIAAESRLKHGEEAVAGIARPDIASLQKIHEEKAKAREEATTRAAAARTKAERLKALVLSLGENRAAIEKAEATFRPLNAVAAAMNGDNDAKVDLETFAIAAMFDRVLDAANLRLKPMSDSRYTLQREQDGGKGAAKRGLGIVVHDIHTGRSRATSTLSGGESFQAALSLALGLSDVVESLSGGIRLDMIFIDEGFGSLDHHTLDQALQTLQDLVGQSRAVGLISHIELVQQVIPNGFQIEKTIKGSIIRTRAA